MTGNRTFVSYSRADSEFALKLASDLRAGGADVWLDQLDIVAGSRWDNAVEDALRRCSRVLVVLSPQAVASQNVLDEVSFAIGENKTVVPVLMAACAIPLRLHRLQHVDFTRGYDAGLTRLLATPPATALREAPSPTVSRPADRPSQGEAPATPPSASAIGPLFGSRNYTPSNVLAGVTPRTSTPGDGGDDAGLQELLTLTRSLSARSSLTDDELQRLARLQSAACQGTFSTSCSSKASDAVQALLGTVCTRQVGAAPAASDEAATIKYDIAKLSCSQRAMKVVLDVMDEQSRNAIRHIKP